MNKKILAKSEFGKIRTRFAPSPTGSLHIGGLRTALYSYALAKHSQGDFLLRIEDTDQKREVKGGKDQILSILKRFNLDWDEDVYVQSELAKDGRYKKAAEKLVSEGHAFYCQCEAKNAKTEGFSTHLRDDCRDKGFTSGAIKLRVPDNEEIKFVDYVLNEEIVWHSPVVFDATLLKSDGLPTYHLAVVVDDYLMKITHVLRGHDWLPSTPIHLLVYKFLGYDLPEIGHLTDILDPEGGKLSKRKGSTSCEGLLNDGYLSEAILNFVMLLGWAPKDNQELFTLDSFVKTFGPNGFQKSNPTFNREKLDWFNGQYIRQKTDVELLTLLKDFAPENQNEEDLIKIISLTKDRLKKLSDFKEYAGFFFKAPDVDKNLFGENYKNHLTSAISVIKNLENWSLTELNQKLMDKIKDDNFKTGDFFMTLRISITGAKFTPPINDSMIILGKEEVLNRLNKLLE